MDLDDQLSALAAGELDPDEARAVRARVASDPALRQRLARHERLQALLTSWDVPAMTAAERAALDARVTDALDALGDGPLVVDGDRSAGRPRPLGDDADRADDAAGAPGGAATAAGGAVRDLTSRGGVTDLGAERAARRDIPSWASGLVAAAAAIAVVGTIGVGLSGIGGDADDVADGQVFAESDGGADSEMTDDDVAAEMAPEDEAADEMSEESTGDGPVAATGVGDDGGGDLDGLPLAVLVEPVLVEDLGSLDEGTLRTVPAQVPSLVIEDAIDRLGLQGSAPTDLVTEDRALLTERSREVLTASDCLELSLAAVPVEEVLVLVGEATFDAVPVVATVTVRDDSPDGGDREPVLVTTVRDASSCEVVAELVSAP